MKHMRKLLNIVLFVVLALTISSCGDGRKYKRAVYLLIDTSGTYKNELPKAQRIINYLLGTMNPGDAFAVARVKSRSFSEKDIIAKATFTKDPMAVNSQKRAFRRRVDRFAKGLKRGSAHTDITGGIIQGVLFLNETGAGKKTIVIFSDMREELDKKTKRNFPIEMGGIKVVAVNVTKLRKDNIDPRLYLGRLDWWKKRVLSAGASEWKVVNDMEHLERVFQE